MDTVLTLINDYGTAVYFIQFLYCALKSGALPLFGGYAAQRGVLDPVLVGTAALAGGYLGDEARFAIARRYGIAWAANKPRVKSLIDKSQRLLERHGTTYMFLYRYPKGMRTIGALPVGLTPITWQRFTPLNAASAITWSVLLVGAGYLFGQTIETAVVRGWGMASVLLLVVFATAIWFAWRRIN